MIQGVQQGAVAKSAGFVDFTPVTPLEAMPKIPDSYEGEIIARVKTPVYANNQTAYKYSGTRQMEFDVNSNDSAADLYSSIIEWTVKTKCLYDGTNNDYRRYFATGGYHSMVRRMYVKSRSGVYIEDKPNYNRQTAFFLCNLFSTRELMDNVMFLEGASVGKENYSFQQYGLDGYSFKLQGTVNGSVQGNSTGHASATGTTAVVVNTAFARSTSEIILTAQADPGAGNIPYVSAIVDGVSFSFKLQSGAGTPSVSYLILNSGDTLTMQNDNLAAELVQGDEILIRSGTSNAPIHTAIVTGVNGHIVTFTPGLPQDVSIASGATVWRKPLAPRCRMTRPEETNSDVTSNYGFKSHWRPFLEFMNLKEFWPLWLQVGGFTLGIEIEDPTYCILASSRYAPSASCAVDYSIINPRFIYQAIKYNSDVKRMWEDKFFAQEGLLFHMPEYIFSSYIMTNASTGNITIPIHIEAVSLRSVFAYIQSNRSWSRSATANLTTSTQNYDPFSTYYDAGISFYQYKLGGNCYPQIRVALDDGGPTYSSSIDVPLSELYYQLEDALDIAGKNIINNIPWGKWMRENMTETSTQISTDASTASHRCIMAASTSFYGNNFAGAFTLNNQTMFLEMQCSASFLVSADSSTNTRYVQVIAVRDSVINLSQARGVVKTA